MLRLKSLLGDLRSSLWFVPATIVAGACALAVGLIEVDARVVDRELLARFPRLFGAGAEGSRGMLSSIAGSMITVAGERAVLPNGDVYTSAILVRTAYGKRRIRFTVGIGYTDSIEQARETIHSVLRETEGVMDDPGPWVYVSDLAPSSVNFTVYFWTQSQQANVLKVSDRVATGIKNALDRAGIDIPFPHTVLLFHDATGTREGDIERDKNPAVRRDSDEFEDGSAPPHRGANSGVEGYGE